MANWKYWIACTLLIGCVPDEMTTVYKIRKGQHSSTDLGFYLMDKNPLVFYAKFDSTAIYEGNADINKLYGFSDCNSQHHENSARYGWRWYNGKLEIFAYVYAKGVRSYDKVCEVEIGEQVRYEILMEGDEYVFSVKGISKRYKRGATCNSGVYYTLKPYFGGDAVAPHDIFIEIKL